MFDLCTPGRSVFSISLIITTALLLVFHDDCFAHPGGLDKNGGHHNRKTGGYHHHGSGGNESNSPKTHNKGDPNSTAVSTIGAKQENDQKTYSSAFPETLRDIIDKQPGKSIYAFGGILACVCGNKVLFTNLVCMPCAGEGNNQESVSQL